MIVGAAVLPAAPLLVPGVSATLPPGVGKVCDAVDAAVEALPRCDVVVVVAAGEPAVYDSGEVTLAPIGRGDVTAAFDIDAGGVERLATAIGYRVSSEPLPLDLAVLALHLGDIAALVPVTVPAAADPAALADVGTAIASAFPADDVRAVVVGAGDLSAGLTEKSPLHLVSGAIFWDEQAVAAVDGGRMDTVGRLGPEEAQRVGARGWAALAVVAGVVASTKLGMVVRHYSAPRGVGYLVANGS